MMLVKNPIMIWKFPFHLFGLLILIKLPLLLLNHTCASKTILHIPTNQKLTDNDDRESSNPTSPAAIDTCDAARDISCDTDQPSPTQDHRMYDDLESTKLGPVTFGDMDKYELILREYSDRHEGRAKILISFAPGHRDDFDDEKVGPGTKFAAELAIKLQKKDYMSYSRLHTLAGVQAHDEFLRRLKNDCRTLILIVTQQYLEDLDSLDVLNKAIDYDTNIIPVLYGMNNMPDDTKWWPNANGPGPSKARNKVIGSQKLGNEPIKVRDLRKGPNEDLVNLIIRRTHGVTRKQVQDWQENLRALSDLNQSKNTDVVVSYSTGNTEHDDQSLGSGTKFVAELAIKLEEEGIRTHTYLHTKPGEKRWDAFERRLKNECKVLVLILTTAFFKSNECLKELYTVDTERVVVFPVRYDSFPKNEEDWWPDLPDEEYENMRRAVIKEGKLDVQLFNDYYTIDEPTDELIDDVKRAIRDRDSVWGTISTMRLLVLVTITLTLCLALGLMFFPRSDTTDKVYDACFLVLQPSSATPSSLFKLREDLESIRDMIKGESDQEIKQQFIICGGTAREIHDQLWTSGQSMIQSQVCFVLACGIDEALWSSYLDVIIKMKPKVVVVCMKYGARRLGQCLSRHGKRVLFLGPRRSKCTVFWARFDVNRMDRQILFECVWIPFYRDLLVRSRRGETACASWKSFIENLKGIVECEVSSIENDDDWHGTLGGATDYSTTLKLDTCHEEGNVEIKMSDFDSTSTKMYGFDINGPSFSNFRASHLPQVEKVMKKLCRGQGSPRFESWQGMRFLRVNIKAGNPDTARDLMDLVCLHAVDDETMHIGGIYNVSQRQSAVFKDKLFEMIKGKKNEIVLMDEIEEQFSMPGDLKDWLEELKTSPITFLFASYNKKDGMERRYVQALETFIGDEVNIIDSSRSAHDGTTRSDSLLHHSRFQGTLTVPPNRTAPSQKLSEDLKKSVAELTDSTPDRIDSFEDDDGSIQFQVGIRDVKHLKRLFHNILLNDTNLDGIYPGAKFSMKSALVLYQDAALRLNTLTEEQIEFLDDIWTMRSVEQNRSDKQQYIHLKGDAGTGKTFVALHCCLDYLNETDEQRLVLFHCPSLSLSYHFVRWLLARVIDNIDVRKALLGKIQFLVPVENEYHVFNISMVKDQTDDLKEEKVEVRDYSQYGLIIVDEAQDIFSPDSIPLPKPLLRALKAKKKDRKVLLLSDTSQAQSVESEIRIPFPIDKSFELKTVSRSSENIVAASLPYQLGEKSKCAHGVTGPRVKVHLFKSASPPSTIMSNHDHDDFSSTSSIPSDLALHEETMEQYASKAINIIQDIKNMLDGQDESIHKFIAILVPSKGFRQNLIINCNAFFKRLKLKAVTAEEAMKRKGPDAADNMPWVVVDTVPNVNGLEFGSVIGVALDQCIDTANPAGSKIVQSRIFRGISRGHYAVYILNHIIKYGWFEWLMSVVVTPTTRNEKDDSLFSSSTSEEDSTPTSTNASSNFDQTRDEFVDGEAVKDLVVNALYMPLSRPSKVPKYPKFDSDHDPPKLWYGDTFDIFICNEDGDTKASGSDNVDQDPNALRFAPTKVGTNYLSLANASANLKANKSYVLEAVQQDGLALQYACTELQADKDIVREAVQQIGYALRHASAELRADKDVVHAAVQQIGYALAYASAELQADKDIVRAAVQQNGYALRYASAELQADKDFVREAVQLNGLALCYASAELKADKDIVREVVRQYGEALRYASAELQADKDIVHAAVQQNAWALQDASAELQADKDIVHAAVQQNAWALRYASAELQADKDIVREAVQQNGEALEYASVELKADKDIVREAVQQYGGALRYASAELQADKELRKVAGYD